MPLKTTSEGHSCESHKRGQTWPLPSLCPLVVTTARVSLRNSRVWPGLLSRRREHTGGKREVEAHEGPGTRQQGGRAPHPSSRRGQTRLGLPVNTLQAHPNKETDGRLCGARRPRKRSSRGLLRPLQPLLGLGAGSPCQSGCPGSASHTVHRARRVSAFPDTDPESHALTEYRPIRTRWLKPGFWRPRRAGTSGLKGPGFWPCFP